MTAARRTELAAVAALVGVAFSFGTSFVVVKGALDQVDPVPYLAVRFTVAAAVLVPIALRRPGVPGELRLSTAAGLTYLVAFVAQTAGLARTTPSASAFLTYLLVVAVPLIVFVRTRERPAPVVAVAVAVALTGLALLTGGGVGFGAGEALTVVAALLFAYHLVQVGDAARIDPVRFSAIQCVVVAVPCLLATPFTGGPPTTPTGWLVGVYAGVLVTACTMIPWAWAQRHVPPTRAALILLTEPVFAAAADVATGGSLAPLAWVGAALILAGAALAELGSVSRRAPRAATRAAAP